MKNATYFSNIDAVLAEKQRLKQSIAQQERIVLRQWEYSKQHAQQAFSPMRLLSNGIGQLLSFSTLKSNPFFLFKIGYKLISFVLKRKRKK